MGMALQLFAVDEPRLREALQVKAVEPKRRFFGLLPGKTGSKTASKIDEFIDDLFDFDFEGPDQYPDDYEPNPDSDDLDKAWDVIRVALEIMHSQDKIPKAATHAVLGTENAEGGPMGGFGWVPVSNLNDIATALDKVSMPEFEVAVNEVPSDTYMAGAREDDDDYFTESFQNLRKFYHHAAKSGKAVMLVIC